MENKSSRAWEVLNKRLEDIPEMIARIDQRRNKISEFLTNNPTYTSGSRLDELSYLVRSRNELTLVYLELLRLKADITGETEDTDKWLKHYWANVGEGRVSNRYEPLR